jgi:phosphatidylglycerol:prolipoprotein diacylglycerol transferase
VRSALVLFLLRHGLPGFLAPDYAVMVGLAGLLGAASFLRLVRADRADPIASGRAIALGYIAALVGGYAFEGLRAVPAAIGAGSWDPILFAGRAAYGGLIAGLAVSILYLRRRGQPIAPFLDRITVLLGVTFACVRTGCFLAGCDYGRPTAGALGVRFPAGSEAAADHVALGWVQEGMPSLPVHPTQLYEAALGLVATAVAALFLRRARRDGRAFTAWLATYAAGRFAIELLRGDAARGSYADLSTAQLISLALLTAVGVHLLRSRRVARLAPIAALIALGMAFPRDAHAQKAKPAPGRTPAPPPPPPSASPSSLTAPPPATEPSPVPAPYPPYDPNPAQAGAPPNAYPAPAPPPPARPAKPPDGQIRGNERRVGLRAALSPTFPIGDVRVPGGVAVELVGVYRIPISQRSRFEIGLEARANRNDEAWHYTVGVPVGFVLGVASHFEITLAFVPGHTWLVFDSPFYRGTNAWGSRVEIGFQFPIGDRLALGLSPLATNIIASQVIGVITTYEPRLWLSLGL